MRSIIGKATRILVICLFVFVAFAAADNVSASEYNTITVHYGIYLNDGNNVEPLDHQMTTSFEISKLDDQGQVDKTFNRTVYDSYIEEVEFKNGVAKVEIYNQNEKNFGDAYVVFGLPDGKYRVSVKGHEYPLSFMKMGQSSDMSSAQDTTSINVEVAGDSNGEIYVFDGYNKELYVTFKLSNGEEYSVLMREVGSIEAGDLEDYIRSIIDAKVDAEKIWEGEEAGDSIKARLRWKLDSESEVGTLYAALTTKGVDEATIIEIMSRYLQVKPEYRKLLTDELMEEYFRQKGLNLDEHLKRALVGSLKDYILMTIRNLEIYQVPSEVMVDEDGYCYVDLTLNKDEEWKKVLEHVVIPTDAEVVELTKIPGSTTKWTIDGTGNTAPKISIINNCPPVDHKVTKKVNETQYVKLQSRQDTFTYTISTNIPRKASALTITDDLVEVLQFADSENIQIKIDGKEISPELKKKALSISGRSLVFRLSEEEINTYGTLPIEIIFKARLTEEADLSAIPDGKIPNIAVAQFDEEVYDSSETGETIVDVKGIEESPNQEEGGKPKDAGKDGKNSSPKSGDGSPLMGALAALALAGTGIGELIRRARRSRLDTDGKIW